MFTQDLWPQFHPEVIHTQRGGLIKNFLFNICGCSNWTKILSGTARATLKKEIGRR
jgi:hypothetical protein